MEGIDPNSVDSSTPVGQIILVLFGVAAVLSAFAPYVKSLKDRRKGKGPKNYSSLIEELDRAKKESTFQGRLINRLHDWQLTARQLIYLYRAELTANGVKEKSRMLKMIDELDRIDEIDVYDYLEREEKNDSN